MSTSMAILLAAGITIVLICIPFALALIQHNRMMDTMSDGFDNCCDNIIKMLELMKKDTDTE